MSFFNNNRPQIVVDEHFLSLPEVKYAMAKFKSKGFAVVVVVLEHLVHRKGRIGLYKNLDMVARYLHMQVRSVIKVVDECGVFVPDHEHGLFYSPRLRKYYRMPVYVGKSEAEDIAANGNVYLGWCRKHSRKNTKVSMPDRKEDKTELSECTEKSTGTLKKDSEKIPKSFKKEHIQKTDNQDKSVSYKDRDISYKDKTTSNRELRKQVPSFSAAAGDDDIFNGKESIFYARDESYFKSYRKKNNFPGIKT